MDREHKSLAFQGVRETVRAETSTEGDRRAEDREVASFLHGSVQLGPKLIRGQGQKSAMFGTARESDVKAQIQLVLSSGEKKVQHPDSSSLHCLVTVTQLSDRALAYISRCPKTWRSSFRHYPFQVLHFVVFFFFSQLTSLSRVEGSFS